ncbi:hypothetical protein [Microbacterium trichothecenolyticum]|uniref:Uncharacterized protein n=1 Tax=Microbacterium trichothecenolyticum TaxID=69370 RepID=A0A0M2HBC7_MICTR|nr:hypothetical protein [Microbacterium trichothecenolyticum]KJL41944.1 hypothetical protein RS82_02561 [Microbacterium trichothecenolyticum]
MSGYLARLAARAGGAPAAAGPRLPSRFEPSTGDGSTDAAAPPAIGTAAEAPAQAGLPGPPRSTDARARVEPVARARDEGDRAIPAPSHSDDRGRPATGIAPEAGTAKPAPERSAVGVHSERSDAPAATTPLTATARVEAMPARRAEPPIAATPAVRASARDEASVPAAEPDVVHVTIGRIEVRAGVTAPATAPRSARPARDPERTLHDYLSRRPR